MDKRVIHRVFEGKVDAFSSSVAIEADNRHITYSELNGYANRLAHLLQALGCQADTIVNVVAPSSIELVGAMLAVFKSGGVYLPVDLSFSERQLVQLFENTYDGIVLVTAEWQDELLALTDRLGVSIRHLIVLDGAPEYTLFSQTAGALRQAAYEEDASWQQNPSRVVTGDQSNYIFYTSGSTGEAKAIVGAHASLSHFIHWELKEFGLEAGTRVSQLTQMTFDASLRDIFVALLSGGTLCIPSAAVKASPLRLLEWLAEARVTLVHCVPSLFRVITQEWLATPGAAFDLSALRYVLMSGEALYAKDILNWRSVAGDQVELVNLYGATETTLIKTFYRIKEVAEDAAQPIPVGGPISNTTVAVVKDGRVCKPGEVGELYIKTPFATKGYYKNAALTQQCFVQNPLHQEQPDIVYKSGDLGRWLPDGNLELLGRIDGQVKVNGIRVELLDVERAMRTIDGVTGVVVKSHQTDRITSLIAYYTGEQSEPGQLREALLKELNAQVIPSWFIWLPTFPLNLNGKVDKKALPLPQDMALAAGGFQPPVGPVETALAACWQEVLGHEAFGRNDSFFGVGGHSLRAIQLVSRVNKAFGVHVRVADVFTRTTIAEQAQLIAGSLTVAYQQIQPVAPSAHYPMSPSQRRLWILSQFEESSVAYHMPGVYVLEGQLSPQALETALEAVVGRHEMLRTVFREDEQGEVRQFINEPKNSGLRIGYQDLRSEENQADVLQAAVQTTSQQPFDLAQGPLFRVSLFQLEDDKWVLAYVMHHIISDAWSMGILISELLEAYNAQVQQQVYAPAPLRVQFKDYAAWQLAQLSGDSLVEHRQFWLTQLGGELPVLELPLDKKRPAQQTFNGASISKRWDAAVANGLRTLCQQQDSTLFMGLLAAVNALLYRYTNQEDIIIGSPTAGREHLDLENQIGFYISTLALRTRFDGQQSFRKLLGEVRQTCLGAFEHQAYPFDALVDDLQLTQDRSRNALYDVAVTLQSTGSTNRAPQQLGQMKVSPYQGSERLICRSDLLFVFMEEGEQLGVALEYNRDLFEKSTAERLLNHLEQLITAIMAQPEQPIREVAYLSAQEREQLLSAFNDTAVAYLPGETIVGMFEQQAQRFPDQPAVVFEGTTLTYRELDAQANRLAHHLLEAYQVGPDELVGIMMDRSEKMLIAMLGVLKSGAAYVPIDPDYPQPRKAYIIQDTGLKLMLTQLDYLFDLEQFSGELFAVDVQLESLQAVSGAPAVNIQPEHLAYVIYTSGSTGTPKGVMIEHQGIANTIRAQGAACDIEAKERGLQFASPSFDASIFEIFIILAVGGTLCIISEAEKRNPVLLERFITAHRLDVATLPPAYLQLINLDGIRSMRKLITAGEAAIRDKASSFVQQGNYYNAYGPTESSICATTYKVAQGSDLGSHIVPIGRPIANTTIYILDGSMALTPVGVVGEICIGGRGLARGYWNNPALTAEKFVPHPFEEQERIYLTGDLGRWLPDGNVEFLGRKDNQVKVNGYRIELGEIEQVMLRQPAVKEAAALVKEDRAGNKNLVVYYVSASAEGPLREHLREALTKELPGYMVPGYFVPVEQIPMTVSGKVDRKKLPEPEGLALPGGQDLPVAPRNELEQQLTKIWEEVLNRAGIGVTDDFFSLGGSSLKAMIIIKRILDELGHTLPIKAMFASKSVELVAQYLQNQQTAAPGPGTAAAPALTGELSYNQLNYFSAWKMGSEVVVESYEYESLDLEAFQWAVEQVVHRHEILRTVFVEVGGALQQQVLPPAAGQALVAAPVFLASDEEWLAVLEQESQRTFDLTTAPLFVVSVYQLSDASYRVVATMHHILTDGYSAGVLQSELQQLYGAFLQQREAPLPPLPNQYRDFAAWQQRFVRSEEGRQHQAYWLAKLTGFQSQLRQLSPAALAERHSGKAVLMTGVLGPEAYAQLQHFAREQKITQPALLIAALTLYLHQLQGDTDITLSATVSGRNSRFYKSLDVSGLIGFFANALLIRNTVPTDMPVANYLQQVQDGFLEDLSHDAYPFIKLMEELPGVTPAILPATGFFNYHNYQHVSTTVYEAGLAEQAGRVDAIAPMPRAYGLTVTEYANCLRLQFKFNPDAFAQASGPVSLDRFIDLLQQIIQRPQQLTKALTENEPVQLGLLN
jgi:amino acid adenylation domain-containing protein